MATRINVSPNPQKKSEIDDKFQMNFLRVEKPSSLEFKNSSDNSSQIHFVRSALVANIGVSSKEVFRSQEYFGIDTNVDLDKLLMAQPDFVAYLDEKYRSRCASSASSLAYHLIPTIGETSLLNIYLNKSKAKAKESERIAKS